MKAKLPPVPFNLAKRYAAANPIPAAQARAIDKLHTRMGETYQGASRQEQIDMVWRAAATAQLSPNTTVLTYNNASIAMLGKFHGPKDVTLKPLAALLKGAGGNIKHDQMAGNIVTSAKMIMESPDDFIHAPTTSALRDALTRFPGLGWMKATFASNKIGYKRSGTHDTVMMTDMGEKGTLFSGIKGPFDKVGQQPAQQKRRLMYAAVDAGIAAGSGFEPSVYQWGRYANVKDLPEVPHQQMVERGIVGDLYGLPGDELNAISMIDTPGSGYRISDDGKPFYTPGLGRHR